jgi:hypothetical protein
VLFPPQLGIKSHTKVFSFVGIWNFCAIDEDWLLFNLVVCEVNMYRFGFVEEKLYAGIFVGQEFSCEERAFF